tara:strand:+ start:494 stop:700 length:207 start_codon:yes stop_codon:yes gene_type:complete
MAINCEGDLEMGIKAFLRLAILDGKKTVLVKFPSHEMCSIFFANLLYTFEMLDIQDPVNIDAILVVPD